VDNDSDAVGNGDWEKRSCWCFPAQPNESRSSCGALKKDSCHNLRAPTASSACYAGAPTTCGGAPPAARPPPIGAEWRSPCGRFLVSRRRRWACWRGFVEHDAERPHEASSCCADGLEAAEPLPCREWPWLGAAPILSPPAPPPQYKHGPAS